MEEEIERLPILRVSEQGRSEVEDTVVREFPLTIILNERELVTLLCSPTKLEFLTAGYLWSEGLIESKKEIREMKLDREKGVVRVEAGRMVDVPFKPLLASGGGRDIASLSARKVGAGPQIKISASRVFFLMEGFREYSRVFEATGGVHSAALYEADNLIIFSEDIGRHNAIDKVLGECLLRDIPTDGHIMITSGRVSSEILLRVARRNIPLLISRSAPTNLGVRLASDLGVTLIGFARGRRMNVYAHGWRVVD